MYKENGLAYQILVLIIIIIIAIAGVLINKIIGRNGVLDQVSTVEEEYNKEEILEKLNHKVTQKFIEINNMAKANNQNIAELYNENVVIEFLKQSLIIEETYDENGNFQDGIYLINVSKLKDENQEQNNNNEGTFKLEKLDKKYIVVYYDKNNNSKKIGELQIQQM